VKPIIAIAGRVGPASRVSRSAVHFAGDVYTNAVLRAGGEPAVVVPQELTDEDADELMSRFDGLVLMGGGDVDPKLYGQEPSVYVYGILTEQDIFESTMVKAAIRMGKPVLAICRGLQITNVALGEVRIAEDSRLAKALGATSLRGASFHHQIVDKVAPGCVAVAWAEDGLLEGIEHTDHWLVGVQWHPEDTAQTDSVQQNLYNEFVAQAKSVASLR
jgi:putative glutamine amidotransferase